MKEPGIQGWLRNRVFLAIDLAGWLLIPVFALALRLEGFGLISSYADRLVVFALLALVCKFAVLWFFGIYSRYWRYASVDELNLIVAGVVVAGALTAIMYLGAERALQLAPRLPRSVPIIDTLLTLIFVGGTRFAVRAFERVSRKRSNGEATKRALIIGAGEAGTLIARQLQSNPQLGIEPVGFIDDDPLKKNRTILGMRVHGGRDAIPAVARSLHVSEVVIAMPRIPGRAIREIRDICDKAKLSTKIMPAFGDIISGRVAISKIREVQIEDLLRRVPVETDQVAVARLVRGMTALVTGAGGSIGSEICRQVAGFDVRDLVLLGHGENSIFDIHNELKVRFPDVNLIPVIADIRDEGRIAAVFEKYRPEAVFHAAAHKHVPLMESNPEEAVSNNIGGTLNLLRAAERVGTAHFVFISTDKAVNPSSVMGASKLVAEQLVHDAAERTKAAYVSVRFGNVLASRGSVVPLFKKQIERGGPVTVTDREMRRYFMTIPEAVQLVLQAAALGEGGETFVLDMGEPVRIVDLARDLIELSGLEIGRDIDIEFTGLRPGEKLFEQLFLDAEEFARTEHDKIFVARNGDASSVSEHSIEELLRVASNGDASALRHLLNEALPGKNSTVWADASVRHLFT